MSAETLREAASLMRERAKAATPGPWSAADEHGLLDGAEPAWCVSNMRPGYQSMSPTEGYLGDVAETSLGARGSYDEPNAEHIASWDPVVALAVADWLDACAAFEQKLNGGEGKGTADPRQRWQPHQYKQALAVARAYLGSDQ